MSNRNLWTPDEDQIIEKLYPTQAAVRGGGVKRRWTPEEDLIIERLYPTTDIAVLEEILDRSGNCIRQRAAIKEIPKCKIFFAKMQSENGKGRYRGLPEKPKKPTRVKALPVVKPSKKVLHLITVMKENIKALNSAGLFDLANLTGVIIERIKRKELKFDFLTIRDGWGL